MMGEANRAFVDRDLPRAVELCHSLVTQAPFCSEPYLTLALVYEAMGDLKKAYEIRVRQLLKKKEKNGLVHPHSRAAPRRNSSRRASPRRRWTGTRWRGWRCGWARRPRRGTFSTRRCA
jgi:hypothetical protein